MPLPDGVYFATGGSFERYEIRVRAALEEQFSPSDSANMLWFLDNGYDVELKVLLVRS